MASPLLLLLFMLSISYSSLSSSERQLESSSMSPFELSMNVSGKPSYKRRRVLLQVSGEALAGDHCQNIDPEITMAIGWEVASVTRLGIQVALVVGGGNIFRGSSGTGSSGLDRSSAEGHHYEVSSRCGLGALIVSLGHGCGRIWEQMLSS